MKIILWKIYSYFDTKAQKKIKKRFLSVENSLFRIAESLNGIKRIMEEITDYTSSEDENKKNLLIKNIQKKMIDKIIKK